MACLTFNDLVARLEAVDRGAFLFPVLGLLVAAGIYAGETITQPDHRQDRIHVSYWEKWTAFEFDAMKKVVDEFNKSQDKIQVDLLSVSGIQDKVLMAVAGNVPPDLAGLYGPNVAQYADDNAVLALDDYCKEAGISRDQYIPVFWDFGVVRNHVYALPSTPATTALHYNRNLFRRAGLDPDRPPKTIEELNEDAAKITTRGPDGKIAIAGYIPAEPGWWNWSWGGLYGGKLMEGDNKITINSKENIRAFTWVQSYTKKYGAGALQTFRSGFGNFSSPQNGFMEEQDAMEMQGVWMWNFIHTFAPKMDWSVAPFPYPADRPDLANPTIADLDVLCIPKGAKHPKEAFEFLKFVQSQKGMELLCMGQKKESPLRKVSKEFLADHPNPYVKLFTDLAYSKNVIVPPKTGIWAEYQDEITTAFEDIYLLKKTPEQALNDVQARIQPKLDQYNERLKARGLL